MVKQTSVESPESGPGPEDEIVFSDLGQVVALGPQAEVLLDRSDIVDDSVEPANDYTVAAGRRKAIKRNFIEHPKRDTAFSALALSGLGFAVGATIATRRRR